MSSSNVGHFYGVYLLCSQSPEKRYNGKCYIGYTVNPDRRINQHNRGADYGGAKRTSNKGPWKMVLIVHGFPNNISALQFEWAWQQPALSSRLKPYADLRRKQPKESHFQYNFRILSRMLNVGPWQRLPLIVRWLEPQYECDFAPPVRPPVHMQIASGQVEIVKIPSGSSAGSPPRAIWAPECHLCMQRIEQPARSRISCLNPLCKLTCHIICLANHIICADARNRGHYIPVAGECPLCERSFTWAALLQRKRKMQAVGMEEIEQQDEDEDEHGDVDYAQYESGDDDEDQVDADNNGDDDVMSSSEEEGAECAVAPRCDVVYELSD